ncbi:unnamed protein product [Knipowitschia caucasica]
MDNMPQLFSSLPQVCDQDEEASAEKEEFGEFSQIPGGADGFDSTLWESAATLYPEACDSISRLNHPVELAQPSSTLSAKSIDEQTACAAGNAEICSHYGDKGSILNACFLSNETDFADFSVFGEQAAPAWCCGLTGADFWDEREGMTAEKGLRHSFIGSEEDVILDSEPKSCAITSAGNICTINHCEKINKSSQEFKSIKPYCQMEWCELGDKTTDNSCESRKERKHSFNLSFLRTSKEAELREESGKKEKSVSTLSKPEGLYNFVENVSCDDGSSQDEPSDFEPNVSSLASQDDTDTDEYQTDDEEELRNYRLSRSFCNSDFIWCNTLHSDVDAGLFYQVHSAAQECSATSGLIEYKEHSEKERTSKVVDLDLEHNMSHVQLTEGEVHSLQGLPPSDSFADFCSAPSQEDRECVQFADRQEAHGQHDMMWCDLTSCQVVLQHQVQQLFLDSFPLLVSPNEMDDPVYGLDVLLFCKDIGDRDEEESKHMGSLCIPPGLRSSSQDIHSAAGLQFQWACSHANRCLLQCLAVDSRNIVFIDLKKQPGPAFAAYREQMEHMKDSLSPEHFPGQTAVATHAHLST